MKTYFITIKSFEEIENKLLYLRNFNIDPLIIYGKNHSQESFEKYIEPYYRNIGPKGSIGCSLSHIKTWNRITEQEDEYSIIFEDDVILEDNYKDILKKTLDDLKNIDFDICYLGYIGGEYQEQNIFKIIGKMLGINREEKMLTENIIIPTVSLATHAYIISKKGALKILDRIKKNKINNHIDYYLHSIKDLKCISCHPRIVFQTSTDTMKSENVKASHPILLTSLLNKVYIDKMVRANYLTCVSFARIGPVDINIISVIFLFIGIILTLSLKKVDVNIMKKVTLFYILLSIPDIYYLNYLETIIFNYILLITPLLTRSFLS